jgi:hypothetical protein
MLRPLLAYPPLTPQQLRNTMNAGTKNKQALIALEQLAGIVSPELQTIGA